MIVCGDLMSQKALFFLDVSQKLSEFRECKISG